MENASAKSFICKKDDMILYAVTDSSNTTKEYTLEMQVEDAIRGGATFVQLREKNVETEQLVQIGKKIKKVCNLYNIPFVIDDNIEAAILCGADGVHVGQNDLSPLEVRARLGSDAIVGVTAKTVEQAKKAEAEGASYLGSGAAFVTSTKSDTYVIPHKTIKEICNSVDIPVVAIGGIDESNVCELKGTDIDGIAVVSAIFAKEDIKKAAENLKEKVLNNILKG